MPLLDMANLLNNLRLMVCSGLVSSSENKEEITLFVH